VRRDERERERTAPSGASEIVLVPSNDGQRDAERLRLANPLGTTLLIGNRVRQVQKEFAGRKGGSRQPERNEEEHSGRVVSTTATIKTAELTTARCKSPSAHARPRVCGCARVTD